MSTRNRKLSKEEIRRAFEDKGAETKTGESRKVPIHPRLRALIEQRPRQKRPWFFTALPSKRYPDGNHHLNMKHVNEDFEAVLTSLGIPCGKKSKGFTLHSLRSSFKTICIDAGIPQKVVDIWQGHAPHRPSASDGYYKLSDEKSQEFMRRVPFAAEPTLHVSESAST